MNDFWETFNIQMYLAGINTFPLSFSQSQTITKTSQKKKKIKFVPFSYENQGFELSNALQWLHFILSPSFPSSDTLILKDVFDRIMPIKASFLIIKHPITRIKVHNRKPSSKSAIEIAINVDAFCKDFPEEEIRNDKKVEFIRILLYCFS